MASNPTIDTYNNYARVYDQEVAEWWSGFPKVILQTFVDNLPGKRILSVGSGSGRDAVLLRDLGLSIVCQDGSKPMIEITSALGFESHLMDFSEINFPPQSFDGIWAFASLMHIPKEEAKVVIRTLRELLKPGGVFAIGVLIGETVGMEDRPTMAARYFKRYSARELRVMIEAIGFTMFYENTYQPHSNTFLCQLYSLNAEAT